MVSEELKTRTASVTSNWKKAFEAGRFQEIVDTWQKIGKPNLTDISRIYLISALSGLGKRLEAESLFRVAEDSLGLHDRILGRMLLSFSATRHLDANTGRKMLLQNVREGRHATDLRIQSYVHLGIGFYRYTYGRLRPAYRRAQRAYGFAIAANSDFAAFLSSDLLGHCQLNLGKIHEGLATLKNSQSFATRLGRGAYSQANEVTLALYRSTYGLDSSSRIPLGQYKNQLVFKDAYMAAQVSLEMARNRLLSGRIDEAEAHLNESRPSAFELGNLRLMTLHQLRLSELHYLRGDRELALSIVEDSLARISEKGNFELRLELALLGQRAKIANSELPVPVLRLTRQLQSWIARRILYRQYNVRWGEWSAATEDELGDLIDGVTRRSETAIHRAIDTERLGLLARAVKLEPGTTAMVFGMRASSGTLFHRGEVIHLPHGLTPMQREFIECLSKGKRAIEELAHLVWREKYSPWRHEKLISSFVSRLRSALPQFDPLIQRRDQYYFFERPILVIDFLPTSLATGPYVETPSVRRDLNERQRAFLAKLARLPQEKFDVGFYQLQFEVSPRTALRDLRELVDRGYARVFGKGKATRYQLVPRFPFEKGVENEKATAHSVVMPSSLERQHQRIVF